MKVFLILIALIIAITLYNQKYLGKLAPAIIVLSLLFLTFRSHIEKLWKKETEAFSEKDKLKASLVSFWNFAEGDKEGVYFSTRAGGNNNAKIVKNEGLVLSSALDWAETDFINEPLTGSKSLVAWATVKDAYKSKGGAPISIFKDENKNFDGIIWAERENNKWMIGSNSFKRTNTGTTTTPDSPINTKQCIVMTQDYSGDNIIIKLYIDGEKVDEYTSPNKTTYEAGKWRLYFGPRHTNRERTQRDGHFIGTIHAAGVIDKALTEDEVKEVNSLLDLQLPKTVKYGETIDLQLIDGQTKEPIPLLKILYAGTKTPAPTELNGNDIVKITDAKDENKVLVMLKSRHLTMIDTTAESKPEYDTDLFLLKPEIGGLEVNEYKEKLVTDPIKYGDKIAIAIVTKRQRNILYNGCGWFGCRVLKPSTGYFGHGGKNRDTVPYTTINKIIKYGETVDLQLIDGQTKEPIPLLKILYADNKTPRPTELNGNHIVKITDAKDENKLLVMLNNRRLTMIDTTSEPKPEYDYDLFLLKPEIGELGEKEYKEKLVTYPIKHGDKIAISVWSKKQGRVFYNGCGYFGCRVLKPSTGYFSHGGKNKDTVPYTTIKNVPMADEKELLDSLNGKYDVSYRGDIRQGVTMEINDGKVRQTSTDGSTKFDETVQTKDIKNKCTEENDQDKTFYIENTYGKGKYECLKKDGDNIKGNHYYANKTLYGEVKYTPLDPKSTGTGTLPDSEMISDPKSTGTGTLPVNEMVSDPKSTGTGTLPDSEMVSDPKSTGTGTLPDSENINQFTQPPTLTKGLTTENVTPSPIYFAPGTVKYGGLGYKPSYEDINYMNNKFITKPEVVSGFNKRGFCDLENNIMENIDKRCEKLPKDVCASTSCCVLLGDQRCVQGNKQGPTNKGIYNDTTIKNKDVYYYRGKCFGNCSDVPNTNSLPQEMPEMDAVNPSPESEM